MVVVEARNLSFRYRGSRVNILNVINLKIESGKILGLSGCSGIGKSTLGDLLLGLLTPTHGDICWNGKRRNNLHSREKRALRHCYQKIFQDPAASFPPHQLIGEALRDVIVFHRLTDCEPACNSLIESVLIPLNLEQDMLHRYPAQLSGGEMQRLALARIMLVRPRFVVADELTSRLDLSAQAEVVRLLEHLARDQNWAVLFISHDDDLLGAVCDQVVTLASDKRGGSTIHFQGKE